MKNISVGIVGLGYWGPNWLRNFASIDGCDLAWGCDVLPERTAKFARQYPAVRFTNTFDDLLKEDGPEAIVIATPTSTHFPLAKAALEAGKHVLVEKPMTGTVEEAEELVRIADAVKKLLLVDHTFAYTGAVARITDIAASGKLGDLLYFDSTRINLGLIQKDISVLSDLAIHDLTILARLVDLDSVQEILAVGSAHYGTQAEDAHLHLKFSNGFAAHIHASWLSPVKIRQTLIAGRKAMVTYDDTEPSEKIRLYDKGVDHDDTKPDPFFPKYRSGDVLIPSLPVTEALATEGRHFLECIRGNAAPLVSGRDGLVMVRILALAQESLATGKSVAYPESL